MREDPSERNDIRSGGISDANKIVGILSSAFSDDPVMNWMFGGRRPIRRIFFELTQSVYLPSGFADVAADNAATLWLPPGVEQKIPLLSQLRIALSAFKQDGVSAIKRTIKAGDILAAAHPNEPHYYLFAVGVSPTMQGSGIGGKIIRSGLARADAEGAPAYLENSNPKNTPLYERLGFKALSFLPLPEGAPPLLAMWRAPNGQVDDQRSVENI